jgi:hypothetical protein
MKQNTLLLAGLTLAAAGLATQVSAQNARPADLQGVWLLQGGGGDSNTGNTATDGTVIASAFQARPQSQWSTAKLPFTAKGLAQFEANKPGKGPRTVKPVFGNDPIGEANPPGLYRALAYSRPIEIAQVPGKVIQLFAYGRIFRIIYTDGRPVPDDVTEAPFWYGYSVGHWEGSTLVVNTLGLDGRAWIDEWGTPISDDARVEERWQRVGKDKLQLQIKVTDPTLYSRPWTSSPVVYTLTTGVEPNEVIFSPMDEKAFNQAVRDPSGRQVK